VAFTAGAIAVYAGDRLIEDDGPGSASEWLRRHEAPMAIAALCAAIVSAGAMIADCNRIWMASLELIVTSLAYPAIRRIALGKTAAVTWAWTLALHSASGATRWHAIDVVVAAVIAATTAVCDLKDLSMDRLRAVPTVPVLLGAGATRGMAVLGLMIAAALAWLVTSPLVAAAVVAQAGPALLPVAARPIIGPLLIDSCLVLSGAIATLLVWMR
jgi:4-hydroxybenzoate polyprenyltransferase